MPAHSPVDIHPLFASAFNAADVEALAALYESDAVLVLDGREVVGRDDIRRAFVTLVAGRARMTVITRAVVASPLDVAVLYGSWALASPTGRVVDQGLSTEIIRKQPDGTWLFMIDNPRTPDR